MRIKLGSTEHKCALPPRSDTCLPKLPPQSGRCKILHRQIKKLFLVNKRYYLTRKYFRSRATLVAEKKRHIRHYNWYIIHPFSILAIFIEITMTIVWTLLLFLDPFQFTFRNSFGLLRVFTVKIIIYVLDTITVVFMSLSFILGYVNEQTNEVILHPRRIAIKYLSSYFLFDFFGCVPIVMITRFLLAVRNPHSLSLAVTVLKITRILRLKTVVKYSRQITYLLRLSDTFHKILSLVVICFFSLHWCACILYAIPKSEFTITGIKEESSWVSNANLTLDNPFRNYVFSFHTTLCYYFQSGIGMVRMENVRDQVICSLITLIGFFFNIYIEANILQLVSSTSASESKYEQLVHTLLQFSKNKKLPQALKLRLLLYYENRFQKKYFREHAIINTLSEHLRYEIILHSCKHLFDKLSLFQGLSKTALGAIIACLTQEVYLPNDVVYRSDHEKDFLYLVAHGTLAVYSKENIEISHIEDGDHFGLVYLVLSGLILCENLVAIETSEIFRMEKIHFTYIYHHYDDFARKVNSEVDKKLTHMRQLINNSSKQKGTDILDNLRHGKILERNRRR